ncbi:MAG TPA: glutamyl-tRNA reductase [Bacteroidetes bacterium]|nr:glutamyl-tRNA reductase [Bacteroidota bacterium]
MNLVCIGISHHTAPLELRERLWFSNDEIRATLPVLKSAGFDECVLFSTCNRTELYAFSDEDNGRSEFLKRFLLDRKSVQGHVSPSHLFSHFSVAAAEHLFRVAAGIDSMITGDVQILAQIKSGLNLATESGTAGFFMNKLFQGAFHVGKRSRSETHVSEGAISVSYAAVELAQRIFDDLSTKNALVIGAGDTAQLTAKHLKSKGIGHLYITNRTQDRAENLANMLGGIVIPFETYCDNLSTIDIILSSVNSDRYILGRADIEKINKGRNRSALFVIDIGVPRNVDPAAKDLENVFLYDLDSLNGMVNENIGKRAGEIPKINSIIAEELTALDRWHSSLQANPTIIALTEHLERIRKDEIEKNVHRFEEKDRDLLELVTKRIVNKILHTPIVNLKNGHDESPSERTHRINTVRKIFGLDFGQSDKKERSNAG